MTSFCRTAYRMQRLRWLITIAVIVGIGTPVLAQGPSKNRARKKATRSTEAVKGAGSVKGRRRLATDPQEALRLLT
jgi:hypothetical protein